MVIREIVGKRGVKLMIDGRLADGTRVREKAASYDPRDPEAKRAAWLKARDTKRSWEQEIAAGIFTPPAAARAAEKHARAAAPAAETVTFGAYVARFLASPRASVEHRARLRPFSARWVTRQLASITKADVLAWKDDRLTKGVMISTLKKDLSALAMLFEDAIDSDIVKVNPVRLVRLPKNDSERGEAYEPAEVEKILAAVPSGLRRVLRALALTGARSKEIRNLTWSDYREVEGVLRVRRFKTNTATDFPVEGELRDLLEECRKAPVVNREYIFADDAGLSWVSLSRGQILTDTVSRIRKRLGIHPPNVDPIHGFRHFFATQAVRRGVPIERLSYLMGHSSLNMTQRYYRVTADDCRDAVRGHSLGTAISRGKINR